ncbi:MAG: hypothetical protein MZW92_39800 [Comamonadaceae bacterium]|nr:hypothetical protein [Comamonadaceae bacterium]
MGGSTQGCRWKWCCTRCSRSCTTRCSTSCATAAGDARAGPGAGHLFRRPAPRHRGGAQYRYST